ncbi:MAG: lipopolysaccharide/colanic/teichoic acid biosynthesis glycosyltransferase [Mariniflexile sp.]|jgi:lipopolysaccharide/colanic/teichoic acid biosynthesis glycosyltransferase
MLKGVVSLVGPRIDIEGYYDKLKGEERLFLHLKPTLTSEAAQKYVNKEVLIK